MSSFARLSDRRAIRIVALLVYYLIVQAMLFIMYVYEDFVTPGYIYQEF